MAIYEFEGKRPSIGKGCYIHPEATIIGAVRLGEGSYVGPGARIRADWGEIEIGPNSNIQENCVIHVIPGAKAVLGTKSHIGHGAILHTPILGEHVVVGMGAIIMDKAQVGDGCCIGAGAVVTEKMQVPANKLVVGVPAKIVGDVSEKVRQWLDEGTSFYVALPPRCRHSMKKLNLEEVLDCNPNPAGD